MTAAGLMGGAAVVVLLTAFARAGSSGAAGQPCGREKAVYELVAEERDRAAARDEAVPAEDLERAEADAFELYCACLRRASARVEGLDSRALQRTPGRRGTPPFVPPRGTPVLTPPGPPVGRPPVTRPPTTPRGRPPFTPPGPPFTPPRPTRTPTPA